MQNIKYGKVSIINKYNIFTTVLSYSEFLDGLAGQYKTKSGELIKSESRVQSYRRFPILFQIRLEDFSMLVNKGWHEGNTDFLHFAEVMRLSVVCGVCGRAIKHSRFRRRFTNLEPEKKKRRHCSL